MEKIKRKDKNSHHLTNYLVEFGKNQSTVWRLLVNARDKGNAMRIGLNKLHRIHKELDITRARVIDKYKNTTNRVCLKIKQ